MTADGTVASGGATPINAIRVLDAMRAITGRLTSCSSSEEARKIVLDALVQVANAEAGWVALQIEGELQPTDHSGQRALEWEQLRPWSHFAYEQRQPVLENNPTEYKSLRNILVLPLFHRERLIGVLGLCNRSQGFYEQDIGMMLTMLYPLSFYLMNGRTTPDCPPPAVGNDEPPSNVEALLAKAFHHVPAGLLIVQAHTGMAHAVNPAMQRLLYGKWPSQRATTRLDILFPEPVAQHIQAMVEACLEQGESVTFPEMAFVSDERCDGGYTCTCVPMRGNQGQLSHVLCAFTHAAECPTPYTESTGEGGVAENDKTPEGGRRRRSTDTLLPLMQLLDQFPMNLILLIAGDPVRMLANTRATELLGGEIFSTYRGYQLSPCCTMQPLEDGTVAGYGLEMALLGMMGEEECRINISGQDQVVKIAYSPLKDENDRQLGAIVQLLDITDERNLEHAKEEFLCITSHELQSPLTVIKGYTDQLLWAFQHEQPLPLENSLQAIERQVERLRRLIVDLLENAAAKINRLHLEITEVALSGLLARVSADISLAHQREIHQEVMPDLYWRCDPLRVEQILRNLLENACKYSSPNSPISVHVTATAHEVRIAVRDNGVGIPPEEVAQLFHPFYRGKHARISKPTAGFGLGLALSHQLAEKHGGKIVVESTVGKGSVFTLVLPRYQDVDLTTAKVVS